MKKLLFVVIGCVLVLCGCQSKENTSLNNQYDEISKAQAIQIINADTSDILETITSKEEIENFITALDMEKWEYDSLPENAHQSGLFVFSQEETLKAGQTVTDGKLYDTCKIYTYQDCPYISFEIAEMNMNFKVTDSTKEYLNAYFN